MSHYDPGEIRTESAARPTPPEKKERLETEEQKNASEQSKASSNLYWLLEFLAIPTRIYPKKFLNNEFAIAN